MKRIYILFDERSFQKIKSRIKKNDQILKFYFPHLDIFERKYQDKILDTYFKEIHNFKNKDIEMFENEIYTKIFLPLKNIFFLIEQKLKEDIDSLVLVGGNKNESFTPLNFGEGENKLKFLYLRRWFFNYYIQKEFSLKIRIEHLFPESRLKILLAKKLRIIIPNYFIKIRERLKKEIKNKYPVNKKIILLSVRNKNQMEYMKNIANTMKILENIVSIFIIDSNCSGEINIQTDRENIIFLNNVKEKKHTEKNKEASVFCSDIVNELEIYKTFLFQRRRKLQTLYKELNENGNEIISFVNLETHNFRAFLDFEFCKKFKIKHIGIQSVLISNNKVPKFPLADQFLCWSSESYENLKKIYGEKKFLYIGPIFQLENYNKYKYNFRQEKIKICIFTQPDNFLPKYEKLINNLLEIKKEIPFDLYIKPHPRDKKIKKIFIKENIKFIDSSVNDILLNVDAGISLTSAVLQEGFLIGTPMISYTEDVSDYEIQNISYLKNKRVILLNSKISLKEFILNFENEIKKYVLNRQNNLKEEFCEVDKNLIEDKIKEIFT